MSYNSGIILGGRNMNVMQDIAGGLQTGQMANQIGDQNALRTLFQEQGAAIRQGDPNALNALAGLNPEAALGVEQSRLGMDSTRQQMRIREEQLQLARAAGARAAATHAQGLSAEQAQLERAQIEQGLATAIPALRSGDLETVNSVLTASGLEPVTDLDSAALTIAQYEGALEQYESAQAVLGVSGPATDATAIEIDRLMQTQGLTREQATAIAYGVVGRDRDPVTGDPSFFNLNEAFSPQPTPAQAPQSPPPSVFNQPAPQAPAPVMGQTPAPEAGVVEPIMPPDADYRGATGLGGLVTSTLNGVTDFVIGSNLFPSRREAATAMENLATRTTVGFASAVAGRPSNYMMQLYENQVVRPNRTRGPEGALDVATQTMALIRQGIQENQAVLASRVTPQMRGEAQRNMARLNALLEDYQILVDGLSGQGGSPQGNGSSDADRALIERWSQ
jgi:hypothetical protein